MARSPCWLLLLVFVTGLAGATQAQDAGSAAASADASVTVPHTFATKLPAIEGFDYVAEVHPSLLRGSQPSARGVTWLKERGVKTVINLRRFHGTSEQAQVEAAGMRYVHIPLEASDPPSPAHIEQFLGLVSDPAQGPVFVHCAHGVDRTGTMLAIYRVERDGWSNAEAFAEMVSFGAHHIWRDLRHFVKSYQLRTAHAEPAPSQRK